MAFRQNIIERRQKLYDEARQLIQTAESESRELTADEESRFDSITADSETLRQRLEAHDANEQAHQHAQRALDELNGGRKSPSLSQRWLPSMSEYRAIRDEARAVSAAGNPFVPVGQANLFADRLRALSVIFGSGIQSLPVANGTLKIPKITASVTVSAIAENTPLTPSDPTFGSVTLTLRKATAFTLASNESLSDSNPELISVLSEDMAKQLATFLDVQMLAGDGTGANMLGIRNWAGVTAGPALGANGATPTLDNYAAMLTAYETAGGTLENAVWIMHPRSWGTIRALKDSQNRYQVNPGVTQAEERSLFGVPVRTSANLSIATTVGTSADTSWVALVDRSQIAIGFGVPENADDSATWRAQKGTLGIEVAYSSEYAFNADQTAIRVIGRFDIQPINAAAVVLMTGVRA